MYRIYKKVPNTNEYKHGLKKLSEDENPFLGTPCLLSLIPVTMWEKEVNGSLNLGMEALKLKTNHNTNSGLNLTDFEGNILSFSSGDTSSYSEEKGFKISPIGRSNKTDKQFCEKYLFPLIENNGSRISLLQAMKNIRNINILAFCDSTLSAFNFEETLSSHMIELNYTEEEISKILSQMCIITYGSDIKRLYEFNAEKKLLSTSISLEDSNDPQLHLDKNIKEKIKQNGPSYYSEGYFFTSSNTEHSTKNYIIMDTILSTITSSIISKALTNSFENRNSDKFIPISKDLFAGEIINIISDFKQNKSKEEILKKIYKSINYSNNKFISVDSSTTLDNNTILDR